MPIKRECEKETVLCRVNIHPIAVSACASGNQRRLNIVVDVVVDRRRDCARYLFVTTNASKSKKT